MRSFPFRYDVRRVFAQYLSNVGLVEWKLFLDPIIFLLKTRYGIYASNTTVVAQTSQLLGEFLSGIVHRFRIWYSSARLQGPLSRLEGVTLSEKICTLWIRRMEHRK